MEAFIVETDPPGADVELSNSALPDSCSLEVKRKEGFVVKIMRDGYGPVEATVSTQVGRRMTHSSVAWIAASAAR
jgi:hypothetical protein